ncbi:head GIN domain-containing protein [Mangrovimonas xylaniphaga]|uniref:head GIN domain-containing protein n=1 Tax=Mangrovimonas xylaniphaga TaxID=1645915 RepID=UPI0006B52FCC|nr:head GIN domain-containing protein [Mangrovimonas xylaniphaga]
MRKLIYIFVLLLMVACDSENANDCFQTSGSIIQQEFEVFQFERILVNRDIEVILAEGDFQVLVETGENLINDVSVKVVDGELQLADNNTCNYVRDYGVTKMYVTAPNINTIRSSTQYDISSEGTLNFPSLQLLSEDYNAPDSFTTGDFRLDVNASEVKIVANNMASFYITGQTENLFIGFYAGAGRFEGEALLAQHVDIYHRGSNDMIVNPQQSLSGKILGPGDVISLNQPSEVTLETLYTGNLIFQN